MKLGIGTLLSIVFLVLKLCHQIDWAWKWIFAPIWIPLVIALFCYGYVFYVSIRTPKKRNLRG